MGADHTRSAPPTPPRVRRILVVTVVPLFLASLVAALVLWPRDAPRPETADDTPRYHGTVTRVVSEPCPPSPEVPEGTPTTAAGPCGTVTVRVQSGPDAGQEVQTPIPAGPGAPRVGVGDDIILVSLIDPEDPSISTYNVAEHQRGKPLIWLGVLFAAAIVAFGRWRGVAALGGLAVTFAILLTFVLPGISSGQPPLVVAIVGASLIMFVVLYLTHGVSAQTSVAVLGTLGSLVLTGLLGLAATGATELTGFGSEDATTLSMFRADVDLHGLLLAGIIIGSLGVLDDVTVTQAAAVTELRHANPNFSRRELYRSATRVGRAHIASVVNTIVLAYAGASLPLLLLLTADSRALGQILTSEFLAQEIVRSVVATLGLVAAVPLTTALAAVVTTAGRREAVGGDKNGDHAPAARRPATDRAEALHALGTPPTRDPSPATHSGWPDPNRSTDTAW
ncbi:YibE/F family protein [Micromonospora sp. Llam7]|uniref:YibE/F family protein n=1 Tax=Micromonospora tarapacensis TaxID=2835305 RepID=UPI001C83FBE8|nr:YibE/F family protein [Micromonospora tarapacensis]MBX7269379.1 YibE/F family protein [Micromonospora tarapacensis]